MPKTFDPAQLPYFTGSETVYRHDLLKSIVYSEGAKYVADSAEAHWLLDIIASYQLDPAVKREEFQVWELKVDDHAAGVVTCGDGNGREVARQEVPITDFPAPGVKLYVENRTIYLPSER